MSLLEAETVDCAYCKGTGKIIVPAEVETVEAYYYGCWQETGHYWHCGTKKGRSVAQRIGIDVYKVDTGFCPGAIPGSQSFSRSKVEGEAALHHINEWTILSFWDNSIDDRPGSHSTFIVFGTYDYTIMCTIAERQFPSVWKRFKFSLKLVEEKVHQ